MEFKGSRPWTMDGTVNSSYATEDISFYYKVFSVQAYQGPADSETAQATSAISIDFDSFNNEEESTVDAIYGLSATSAISIVTAAYALMF